MKTITCILALALAVPAFAQKKKKTAQQQPAVSVEQQIQSYRFSQAASQLQSEISRAEEEGRNTDRLQADLQRAHMGEDMLRGTECVTFIDSMKVARKDVLTQLRLSPEIGHVVAIDEVKEKLQPTPVEVGRYAFVNDFADRIYYASTDSVAGVKSLHIAYRQGQNWTQAQQLSGMQADFVAQDNPFVMPDGVTVYFASQGPESLGGYDLFVTRQNPETREFLKAENLGMPFNSPANDYFLCIDETAQLGWLVTDRGQTADSVSIYVFVPSESREVYPLTEENREEVLSLARLESIALTQQNLQVVNKARQRLAALRGNPTATVNGSSRRYVIAPSVVYTSLEEFRSPAARRIAEQADQVALQLERLEAERDGLQMEVAYSGRQQVALDRLRTLNQEIPQLREQFVTLSKNMRLTEAK